MAFRQIKDAEMSRLATQLLHITRNRNVLSFAREVYGEKAANVLIKNDGDTYGGLDIEDVEVTDHEANEFLPAFGLDFWQTEFAKEPTLEEDLIEAPSDTVRLEIVKEYLKDNSVYESYDLDPEDDEVITLSELGPTEYPRLYLWED